MIFEDETLWVSVDKELPPKDGLYEVSNDKKNVDVLYYDGFGFYLHPAYRPVQFWRKYQSKPTKKYGKLDESN
jgi:hypothetical protein